MDAQEVQLLVQKLSTEYSGNTYNLITRNCNHFCNDLCMRLTSKQIPNWVNRLARLGNNLLGCYFSLNWLFYFFIFWIVWRVDLLQYVSISVSKLAFFPWWLDATIRRNFTIKVLIENDKWPYYKWIDIWECLQLLYQNQSYWLWPFNLLIEVRIFGVLYCIKCYDSPTTLYVS